MKRYGHSYWISLAVLIIGILLFIGQSIALIFAALTDDGIDQISKIYGKILFIAICLIGVWIYKEISLCLYLHELKKTGNETNILPLKKSSKLQIIALFLHISYVVFLVIAYVTLYNVEMDLLENPDLSENYINNQYFNSNVLKLIGNLIFFIMNILNLIGFIKLSNWSKNFGYKLNILEANKMANGLNLLKIGAIIQIISIVLQFIGFSGLYLFLNFVCFIIFCIGFIKSGKNMEILFRNQMNLQNKHVPRLKQTQQNININQQDPKFCPFCGVTLINENSQFCSKCGRKLN